MAVRFIGATRNHGPVAVDDTATIERNALVQLSSGEVVAMTDGANAALAVALDKFPDAEYEEGSTAKPMVQLALLGEDTEIELPFLFGSLGSTGAIAQSNIGAASPYRITAAGAVNLDSTTNGVFTIRRLGRDTAIGDATGFVIGVVTDAAAF